MKRLVRSAPGSSAPNSTFWPEHRACVTVSSVCFESLWLRLGFLPLAGVPGGPFLHPVPVNPPLQFLFLPEACLGPYLPPPPTLLCPYALGVLISHFLPRPGAWPGPCPSRSCALPQTLYSKTRDPSNQQQDPDSTHHYYEGLS